MSTAIAESRWGLGFVFIISLFTFEVALFFLFLLIIYIKIHVFPRETIIRNASKGGKPNRKQYLPYGFKNRYKTINQRRKLKPLYE
jgi:hypothetical protein